MNRQGFFSTLTRSAASRFSVLFLALVLPLCFSIRLEDGFELTQTLGALLVLSFLILMTFREGWAAVLVDQWRIVFPLLAFLGLGVYSYLGLRNEVFFYFPTQNYFWILVPILFLVPLGGWMEKRKFYIFLVLGGVLGSLYSFAQVLGMDLVGWSTQFGGRSFSTMGNPVFWAGHLLLLLPLAAHLAFSSTNPRGKWGWGVLALVLVLSLFTTQSRGAWIGFVGEIILLGWFNRDRELWKFFGMALVAFLLALLLVPSWNQRTLSAFQARGSDAQGRYFMWKVALQQWEEKKWLGQGPGGYAGHFHRIQSQLSRSEPKPYWTAVHAHNEFLELLAERGVVGCLLGAWILGNLILRRLKERPGGVSMARAELTVMAGIALLSFFNFPLGIVPTACALALLFNPSWEGEVAVPERVRGPLTEPRIFVGAALLAVCGLAMGVAVGNAKLHRTMDLIALQRDEEAVGVLDNIPSSAFFHYSDPRIWQQKAAALDGLGRFEEATHTLELGLEVYPYDADLPASLCMFYAKQKKWETAQEMGFKALELAPFHEQALNNLAMVAYLRGRPREAAEYLSRLSSGLKSWGQKAKAAEIDKKIIELEKAKP